MGTYKLNVGVMIKDREDWAGLLLNAGFTTKDKFIVNKPGQNQTCTLNVSQSITEGKVGR